MIIEYKGSIKYKGNINSLVRYLEQKSDKQKWEYSGLIVELDPPVDFTNQNMLVRWLDVNEGLNYKIIVNSIDEFKVNFKEIYD